MSKIVTACLGLRWDQLPENYVQTLKRFNPSIKNIHQLDPGQTIRIPELIPGLAQPSPSDQDVSWSKATILETAKQLDTVFTSGECDFPGSYHDDVRLELGAFPVIELEDGRHLIVQTREGLPENMEKLMRAFWTPLIAIEIDRQQAQPGGLEKIFCAIFGEQVQQSVDLPALHGGVQVTLRGDWVLLQKDDTGIPKRHYCITLISHPEERTSDAVMEYLAQRDVLVADVLPQGVYEHKTSSPRQTPSPVHMMSTIDGSGQEAFVSGFVRAIGYSYDPYSPIPYYYSGFHGKTTANFIRGGKGSDIVVDFGTVSDDEQSDVEATGVKVLSVKPDDELSTIAKNILELTGTSYDENPVLFAADRSRAKTTSVTIPGLLVSHASGKRALFTQGPLHPKIREFLSEKQIKLFKIDGLVKSPN
jgi:hypothetical protein